MSSLHGGLRYGSVQDVRELIRMHERCSPLTITHRYLSPLPVLSSRLAARLLCPPHGFSLVAEREVAIIGVTTVAPHETAAEATVDELSGGCAGARATIGQLVVDGFQGQGLGTAMFLAAAREAGRRGYVELVMSVLPDNPAVLPMVHAVGMRARVGTTDGLTQVSIGLHPPSRPHDRTRVVHQNGGWNGPNRRTTGVRIGDGT